MIPVIRNVGISLGKINQSIVFNISSPTEFGLPPVSEPHLTRFSLDHAFDDGEPDLFRLLRWDYGLVEALYGRDDDLRAILKWASHGDNAATARLITGEGGAGKTRLATEAASKLREQGWTAGFLPRNETMLFNVAKGGGLFLILDYPEEQLERTRALFAKLAELKSAPYPIRLLLLSRRPFEQWRTEGAILEGRFGRQAVAVLSALSGEDGQALIAEAARRFSAATGRPQPNLASAPQWLAQSPLHALPLFALAAAIHSVLAPQHAFGLGGTGLMRDLATREHRRVQHASRALRLGDEGLARLLALGVLADGLSQAAVKELADANVLDEGTARDVVGALSQSPWWSGGRLIRLQPDRPAAAFVDQVLFPPNFPNGRAELPDWLFIALAERASTFSNRIRRLHYDLASLDRLEPAEHQLDWCLGEMLRRDPVRAEVFSSAATSTISHCSASFSADVARHLVSRCKDPNTRAGLLTNRANYLSVLGRFDEALACAEKAVKLRRDLARTRPTGFNHDLAMSLLTLATSLSEFNRVEDALACAKEGVDLYRQLARSGRFDANRLASSIATLANMLKAAGRHEEALACAEEAVNLHRALVLARPESFDQDLAVSLTILAHCLSNLSRHEEAVACAEEAVVIRRTLGKRHPEIFNADLGRSLAALSTSLSQLNRHEDALACAEEAVRLYRGLPLNASGVLGPLLHICADQLWHLGRREEALSYAEEAVTVARNLTEAQPEVYKVALPVCLMNLALKLSTLNRHEEALTRAEEAIRVLTPPFLSDVNDLGPWMEAVVQVYKQCCHASGAVPNSSLLYPILALLDVSGLPNK